MKMVDKIKAFFKGEKATTKAKPVEPPAESAEKKTTETSGQEGTKEQGT